MNMNMLLRSNLQKKCDNNNGSDDEDNKQHTTKTSNYLSNYSPCHQPLRRPSHLFSTSSLNYINNNFDNNNGWRSSPSSEEDNSPTQMNNCRKFIDKAPLVKRLSINLLKTTEEYRPLLRDSNYSPVPPAISTTQISTKYYTNASTNNYEQEDDIINSKFGDSCRKSLTSVLDNRKKDYCDFDLKRNFLRETSSANSSPKMFPYTAKQKRIRGLSLIEQAELKEAPWFQIGVPREISLELLRRKNPGDFLVRESTTKPGCFALSLRAPPPAPKVVHYLILRTPRGYKIKGCAKEFSSLKALITHHSVMPEQLPVPLALPRPQNLISQRRNLDDFETYSSLSDFHKMMLQT